MSKFLMLECNRLNSQENYKGIDEEEDRYKNKWTNNVNSYGIEVDVGDIIELNSSSINTRGTIENAIEFLGDEQVNSEGFVDNKLGLELGYYINDTRSYNLMLPLIHSKTYVSHGAVSSIVQDPTDKYTNKNYLVNRGLGEPLLEYERGTEPSNDTVMPQYETLDISITAAGSNFSVGSVYTPVYDSTTSGDASVQSFNGHTGAIVTIDSVDANGAILGLTLTNAGSGYTIEPCSIVQGKNDNAVLGITNVDANGAITAFALTNAGSGYTEAGENGTADVQKDGTNGVIKISSVDFKGTITSVSIVDGGSGYSTGTAVIDQQGTGANGTLSIDTVDGSGAITAVTLTNGGTGYRAEGVGMKIQISNIENVGTVQGAVTAITILDAGRYYGYKDVLRVPAPSGGTDFKFTIDNYINLNTYTKLDSVITGKRYFPPAPKYTGPAIIPVNGLPDDGNFNVSKTNASYYQRFNDITLDVETGLNTPQNVSDVLTKKLKQTKKIDNYNSSPYIEDKGYSISRPVGGNPNPSVLQEITPPLIQTPTYLLNAVNYNPKISPIELDIETYAGIRKYYYQSIAYENPQKLQALMWSRQLKHGTQENDVTNELNSGYDVQASIGDFNSEQVGNLGLNCCLMRIFQGFDGSLIKLQKGTFVLTNVYFTKDNIERIAGQLKLGERYYGDLSKRASPTSQDFKDNLGIAFDIGLYVDELSQGNVLKKTSSGDIVPNQRQRFYGYEEYSGSSLPPSSPNHLPTDSDNPCLGTQDDPFFEGKYNNDGQQLSQMVIKSRFSETLTNYTDANHAELLNFIEGTAAVRFNVVGTAEQIFNGSYIEQSDGKEYTAADLIDIARQADIAAIPVFPVGSNHDFVRFGGRPYIAFVSLLETTQDEASIFNPTTFENWKIDTQNCQYGLQLGYDCSFIRNNAIQMRNVRNSDIEQRIDALYLGASDMSFDFDTNLSRFTITGMNTPMTVGNGFAYNEFGAGPINDASANPEQTCALISSNMGIQGYQSYLDVNDYRDYFDMKQRDNSIIDSYSGIVINGVNFFDKDDGIYRFQLGDSRLNDSLISGTLLSKMGFSIFDILPRLGTIQTPYNPISSSVPLTQTNSYLEAYRTQIRPITSGLFISSPELQAAAQNTLAQPTYDIGLPSILETQPSALQGSIVASSLPTKLDYPYLIVHSSICATNVDTKYYGGRTGKSQINAIGVITRNYNQGDFFYGLGQTYYYTAVKRFVLTEVTTEILLPDGSRPELDPASAVIYKITKPLIIPQPMPVEQAQKKVIAKKKQA